MLNVFRMCIVLFLFFTFSSKSYSQYRQYESSSHIDGALSAGTGAQYGGLGLQAGINFGTFSTHVFGGTNGLGAGVNIKLNNNASVGISYSGGFAADIAEATVNFILDNPPDDTNCDRYDDCDWIDITGSVDESYLSVSFIYDSNSFYNTGWSYGIDLGIKKEDFNTDYRKDSEYEPFLGLSVGFRF